MKPSLIYNDGVEMEIEMSPEQIKDAREAKENPFIDSITVQVQNKRIKLFTKFLHEIQ